jgi:hypothetical protein
MVVPRIKIAKLMLRLLGAFVAVSLIFMLVLPLLGAGWHLVHRGYISYGGWRIPVPKQFYPRMSENGPTMWKLAFGAPFFDAPYGHISLYALGANQKPFACERDYSRFETSVTQEAAQSGYRLESKLTTSPGKDARYCLAFAHSGGKPRSLLRCAIEDNNTILFYEGDSRYLADVIAMLRGMSHE